MDFKQTFYPESKFGGFSDIDGSVVFYNRVNALIDPTSVVLDIGCGRGAYGDDPIAIRRNLRIIKGKAKKVIGIDVDEAAKHNPFLDEFHLLDSDHWPLDSNSVDLIICDSVLEHLEDPEKFFVEIHRILKDGGFLCIRTPNSWSYVAVLSRLIPNQLHANVLARVQDQRKEEDVFPTYYKCNSLPTLKSMMSKYGFDHSVYGYEAEPSYLSFAKPAYWLGVVYQRFAPNFLKPAVFAFGKIHKGA